MSDKRRRWAGWVFSVVSGGLIGIGVGLTVLMPLFDRATDDWRARARVAEYEVERVTRLADQQRGELYARALWGTALQSASVALRDSERGCRARLAGWVAVDATYWRNQQPVVEAQWAARP